MTKLTLDDMLETLHTLKHPTASDCQIALEAIGSAMARRIARELLVDAGPATFQGCTEFGGTCAAFRPSFPGQPCPPTLADYDATEWN
jgi:hypothetical protein